MEVTDLVIVAEFSGQQFNANQNFIAFGLSVGPSSVRAAKNQRVTVGCSRELSAAEWDVVVARETRREQYKYGEILRRARRDFSLPATMTPQDIRQWALDNYATFSTMGEE